MEIKIESERLILRPWGQSDIQALFEGLNDFDVAKNLTIPFPYTLENAKSFINDKIKNKNIREKSYFAIVEKSSGNVIGGTSIEIVKDNIVKGGIWITLNYQGKGYGTEAMRIRNKHCFDELNAQYLENGFLEENEKSWHMQEKLGYKKTGEVGELFCPARDKMTKEIKTKLTKTDFVEHN